MTKLWYSMRGAVAAIVLLIITGALYDYVHWTLALIVAGVGVYFIIKYRKYLFAFLYETGTTGTTGKGDGTVGGGSDRDKPKPPAI